MRNILVTFNSFVNII